MSLLGIDIGSSRCKGVAFTTTGEILAASAVPYTINHPAPGQAEVDAEVFWSAVVTLTRKLAEMTVNDPIESLAISSHGETFIPVDKNGNALGPAIMNSDNRAVAEANELENTLGREHIYAVTGLPVHAMYSLSKIVWLKKHSPDLFRRVDRFCCVEDYILTRLGLPARINYSSACRMMAFDILRKTWSTDLLTAAGLSRDCFSEPVPSGLVVGSLSDSMAAISGLRPGTLVASGGHDQPCGALGAGVIGSGEVSDSAGTYECLTAVSRSPCNTPASLEHSLNSYCHVVPDQYVTLAFFPAGLVCRWFIEQFCEGDLRQAEESHRSIYEFLEQKVMEKCPGPTGICMTPHLVGACNPHWDVQARGAIMGLTPAVTKYHLYKALYEGISCELDANLSVLEKLIGSFETIRIFGGNSESEFTIRLRADITGKTFQPVRPSEACCRGAAILAGMAAGVYKNPHDGIEKMLRSSPLVRPEAINRYEKQKNTYRKLYPSLKTIQSEEN